MDDHKRSNTTKNLPAKVCVRRGLIVDLKRIPAIRALKYYWIRLLRLHGDPSVIARGVALGVFVGLTPTIPFHTMLILFFSVLLRANALAGIIASWLVSNPFTIPLQYFAAWKIGVAITGADIRWQEVKTIVEGIEAGGIIEGVKILSRCGIEMILSLVLGGVALSSPFALCSYAISLSYFRRRQARRRPLYKSRG